MPFIAMPAALRRLIAVLATVLLATAFAPAPATAQTLTASYHRQGLDEVNLGSHTLIKEPQLQMLSVSAGKDRPFPTEPARTHFDRSASQVRYTFDWGVITVDYKAATDRFGLDVTILNTSRRPLHMRMKLLDLTLPQQPQGETWREGKSHVFDTGISPAIVIAHMDDTTLAAVHNDVYQRLRFGLSAPLEGRSRTHSLIVDLNHDPVIPGQNLRLPISIRVAPPDAGVAELAPELVRDFARAYPFRIDWDDRRPIGALFLAKPAASYVKNPQGWFSDPRLDMFSARGKALFAEKLRAYAKRTVLQCQAMDAQGVIVFDVEGQGLPAPLSYVGDPRMLGRVAPEMEALADEFFATLRAGKLRTGITIRPTAMTPDSSAKFGWKQMPVDDPVELLSEKITYAKRRWGCTLFYVHNNVAPAPGPDGAIRQEIMPAAAFERLTRLHPDVLLIPQHQHTSHWAHTAPYLELRDGHPATPDFTRAVYPKAFSAIYVPEGDVGKYRQQMIEGVRAGDILLFHAWRPNRTSDQIKAIYQAARE